MTELTPLTANDPVVIQAMQEAGIEPHKNGGPAKPVGSSKKIHMPKTNTDSAPASVKTKKITVQLSVEQEARLLREAANRKMDPKSYLQLICDKALSGSIGKAFVTSPGFNDKPAVKVTAPTNSYGRQV